MSTLSKELLPTRAQLLEARKKYEVVEFKRCLSNIKKTLGLKVGNIIVNKNNDGSYEKIGESLHAIKKWLIVYIDSDNLIYTKRLLMNGTYSKKVTCISTNNMSESTYVVDPLFLDCVILNDEKSYDPFLNTKTKSNKGK